MLRTPAGDRGFSLVELVAVLAVSAVVLVIAVPQIQDFSAAMRLGQSTREMERELQTARLRSVSTNRRIRVRFNCPADGFYRMVEYLGEARRGEDTAATRCTENAFPFPAADRNPITLPNHDGPLRIIPPGVTVTTGTLEFRPDGRAYAVDTAGTATPLLPAGTDLTVTYKAKTKRININALGKIAAQ